MFNIPIEKVTKTSDYRYKGKLAELALGYQGGVNALKNIGGEAMGLSMESMKDIVSKWRKANKKIAELWTNVENDVRYVIRTKSTRKSKCGRLEYKCDENCLQIKLPSGRCLFYQSPGFMKNSFDNQAVYYMSQNQTTKQWQKTDQYGGKFVENIVQAIARDLLANSMLNLEARGFKIIMHVHDEVVIEILDLGDHFKNEKELKYVCEVMSILPDWAPNFPLGADGYITPFYKKE